MVTEGLVTIEDVKVLRYRAQTPQGGSSGET
jgi:hypothetical protein